MALYTSDAPSMTSRAEPAIAAAARAALEEALKLGAVSLLLVYETRKSETHTVSVPPLECIRRGLLAIAKD